VRLDFLALAAACLLCACAAPNRLGPPRAEEVVYVIGRGWHTDIGLPSVEITGPLTALERPFPGVRVLTIGFGDRRFVLTGDRSPLSLLKALLPGRGALLVTALSTTPEAAFGSSGVVTLHISRGDLDRLQARLWDELQRSGREPIQLASGPYPGSLFYAAAATYSGLYTCNTWTAEMARAGGVPIPATGVVFAGQVMGMARWIASHQMSLGLP
jgi:hypothetical protein